jgi:integrase
MRWAARLGSTVCAAGSRGGTPLATIEQRRTKNKRVTHYRVKWRTGGTREGKWDGEPFDDYAEAKKFKALVEVHGQHRPPADELLARGFGHLVAGGASVLADAEPVEVVEPESAPPITFEQYAGEFLDRLVKPNPETVRKYLERLRLHVFPVIGHRPIAEITRREMREWQKGLMEKLSPKTIANIRGETVYPIFEAACLPGEDDEPPLRSYNPLKGLPMPDPVKYEREILEDREEAQILLDAAYSVDPEAADLLVTLLSTAMRWGEAAGLPIRAVHPSRGTVSIRQVLRRQKGRWFLVPKPKTKDGWREIPVPPAVMAMLVKRCEGRSRDSLVFTAPRGGFWRHPAFHKRRWGKIRDLAVKNGLPKLMTMYGLRHSLLTWLASEGCDLLALRQMAGHKRISTTFDIYVHNSRRHHEPVKAMAAQFVGQTIGKRPHADEPPQASQTS